MRKETAVLTWSLYIECPYCHTDFDLAEYDDDSVYSMPIFNNKWDDLKGEEVECPDCGEYFAIKEAIY